MIKTLLKYQILEICLENLFRSITNNILMGKLIGKLRIGQHYSKITNKQQYSYYDCYIEKIEGYYLGFSYLIIERITKGAESLVFIYTDTYENTENVILYLNKRNIKYGISKFLETSSFCLYDTYENLLTYYKDIPIVHHKNIIFYEDIKHYTFVK